MARFTEPLGRDYGARAIAGKGGLPDEVVEPMKTYGWCTSRSSGGSAALETTQIEEIEEVAWEELMPECLWKFRVKDFGPLTVAIDSHGNSLYHDVQQQAKTKLEELYAKLTLRGTARPTASSTSPPVRQAAHARSHARHRQGPEPS